MMKITVGMGSIDDYIAYVRAGADEVFCGYVPWKWMREQGANSPLNRREVLYYNVQLGSRSELKILHEMAESYGVPVTMTLNSLYYLPDQYPQLKQIICRCRDIGFNTFIIADPALLLYLKQQGLAGCRLYLSGETAEVNHLMIEEMRSLGISRVIFHRKVTIEDMRRCIDRQREIHPEAPLEYEAFVLNEMCHFTGAFCQSLHCDELAPICRVPYILGGYREKMELCCENEACGDGGDDLSDGYLTGRSGCGLCALWQLREAGITHLKLVSRGNYSEDTVQDIRQMKKALYILQQSETEADYQRMIRQQLFEGACSGVCYYLTDTADGSAFSSVAAISGGDPQ